MIKSVLVISLLVSPVLSQNGCSTCEQQGTGSAQTGSGQCLPNGQSCQWDTSLGDCCSTYCYQQVGQSMGVCQDRPASSQSQTQQKNPPSYGQTGGQWYPSAQTGQCLPNGQSCQWDTSVGNCCSTYCYQQVGQTVGVCQDRPAGSSSVVQRNPPTHQAGQPTYQTGCTTCQQSYQGNGQPDQRNPSGSGQCIQNGQSCQWDTSMGNCCSTYCYQQAGQSTGICQTRYGSSSQPVQNNPGTQSMYNPYPTYQPSQNQPCNTCQQNVPSNQNYGSSCLQIGQTCTYSGSMGNCCSGWCRQLEPQATGTCQQPGSSGSSYQQGAQMSQPSSQVYYSPAANSQTAGGCLSNGQACTWSGSMGNCCSGWCRQMENEATGTCSAKLSSGYLFRL